MGGGPTIVDYRWMVPLCRSSHWHGRYHIGEFDPNAPVPAQAVRFRMPSFI
jgi:hypothetical protein